jgi:hypothetical protein
LSFRIEFVSKSFIASSVISLTLIKNLSPGFNLSSFNRALKEVCISSPVAWPLSNFWNVSAIICTLDLPNSSLLILRSWLGKHPIYDLSSKGL